jgi:hypothetical protein
MRRAFTLIEVLAILLVVAIGLAAATGLFTYALKLSFDVQARSTAMSTAMTVAVDGTPLLDPDLAGDWQVVSSYAFDDPTGTAVTRGLINGYYAVRSERSDTTDIIAQDGAVVHARAVQVDVDVFETVGGRLMASYSTRMVRQRGGP